jgi:aminopeptidase N
MMNKLYHAALLAAAVSAFIGTGPALAQQQQPKAENPQMKIYRETTAKINDLVHTKLDVRFDYKKRYLYGKEWVTLKPHFYPTDSLRLDAKGMDIKSVAVVKNGKNVPLKYSYDDSTSLAITLDKTYRNNESYTLYIDYTAKPNELKVAGSSAISDAKGLYFINPDGTEKDKPTQIWTQGESESSSAWFPTIDKPNQKTTQELSMTVLSKYVTLSNGKLVSQKTNADGTRTDTWKMDLPHSPYLFMMAVGDFKIYKDKWRTKEVNYYLEPKYAPYAKEIFSVTPEAMEFYSKTLGVDYPWVKYAQIVVRDYVSGAMENTSATLHGDYVQATKRQLIDRDYEDDLAESTIVHELFHQWFGDYVTAESWSNLTVNESFADFSETMWAEYKYGMDAGQAHIFGNQKSYLGQPSAATKNLVRFHYNDKEDVFDVVTYQKGGSILYMLRNYLGNDAFYKGLNIYLRKNALGNGEAQQLRLALEEASGRDLTWFFNQWYYRAGHPVLNVSYQWDAAAKKQTVYLQQTQEGDAFVLPMAVDIYAGGKKTRHMVWMRNKADTLTFNVAVKPSLVNVDADKVLLAKKTDNKTIEELSFQYFNAPMYRDRYEAVEAALTKQDDKDARRVLIAALKDKYYGLRLMAIRGLNLTNDDVRNAAVPVIASIAQTDAVTNVRAAALLALAKLKASGNMNLFKQSLSSQSYAVQGAALTGIAQIDAAQALQLAKGYEKDNSGALTTALVTLYVNNGSDEQFEFVNNAFNNAGVQQKFNMLPGYVKMLGKVNNTQTVNAVVADMKKFAIKYKAYGVDKYVIQLLTGLKAQKDEQLKTASDASKIQLKAQSDFISITMQEINEGA